MALELTKVQTQALKANGDPLEFEDPETNTTYVLLRKEVYEQLKAEKEAPLLTTGDMLDRVMAEDDMHDPTLAFYQQKYGRRP